MVLALYLSYGMQVNPRSRFYELLELQRFGDITTFIIVLQQQIMRQLVIPAAVIQTSTLGDNVLAVLCSLFIQRPLLIVGEAGMGKTLAISLVLDNIKGQFSHTPLLQKQPRCQTYRLQLSHATTASHVERLTSLIESGHLSEISSDHATLTIVLEELSMAQMGPQGPLKVPNALSTPGTSASVARGHNHAVHCIPYPNCSCILTRAC